MSRLHEEFVELLAAMNNYQSIRITMPNRLFRPYLVQRHPYIELILLGCALCGVLLHTMLGYSIPFSGNAFGSDDAFISYRYAEHLISGHGLVFNIGEAVEGYSNFLYTVTVAPALLFDKEFIYPFSVLLNAFLLCLSAIALYHLTAKYSSPNLALLAALLLCITPVLWANAATGLESIAVLTIFMGFWWATDKDEPQLYIFLLLCLASILCRVDGFLLASMATGTLLLRRKFHMALKAFSFIAVAMLLYTLARLYFYDDYIANTYHAKVTGHLLERLSFGISLLAANTKANGLAIYLLFTGTAAVLVRARSFMIYPLLAAAYLVTYYIYIGGDIYYERFLLPLFPIGIFSLALITNRINRKDASAVLFGSALLTSYCVYLNDDRFAYRNKDYDMWEFLGRFLKEAPRETLLAVDAAGKIPYYSELPTLDMLGLNDRFIGRKEMNTPFLTAHSKYDPDYVLSRNPGLITAWIDENRNMAWGLSREKYRRNYELIYLLNSTLSTRQHNIVSVAGIADEQIKALIAGSYNFAVLARRDLLPLLPKAYAPFSPPHLLPGSSIDHSEDGAFIDWYSAEPQHRWSKGNSSRLVFRIEPKAAYRGKLRIELGSIKPQQVNISFNQQFLTQLTVDSWQDSLELELPLKALRQDTDNTLELKFSDAHTASESDSRTIAVAFRKLTLE